MIIDSHNHPDWYGYDLVRFLDNMDKYGIDKTWLLSWECPPDEFDPYFIPYVSGLGSCGPIPFSRVVSYMERAPGRFIPGYCPDPRRADAVDKLRSAVSTYGVKICGELKVRMMYDNPDALRLFRYCGETGLPVTVHIDYELDTGVKYPRPSWWYGGGIEALERAVIACPETIFLGHAPGFWAHISADGNHSRTLYPEGPVIEGGKLITMMERYPNLYCDMSAGSGCNAMKRDPAFAKRFLIQYQDRILYGRDFFDNGHQELLNSLDLPKTVLEKIYSGNAQKLVK
jgi:predicted TIM-barrel fold metal-dependent hydrolase